MSANYSIPSLGEEIELERVLLTDDTIKSVIGFSGEVEDIEFIEFFRNYAVDDNESRSYVYINKATGEAIACVSLACSVLMTENNDAFSDYSPAVLIDKFIVDKNYRHLQYTGDDETHTLSSVIFIDIISMIREMSKTIIGAKYVVLYSIEEAHSFYKNKCAMVDFKPFMRRTDGMDTSDCIPMYRFIDDE